jgi:hypothetical protein
MRAAGQSPYRLVEHHVMIERLDIAAPSYTLCDTPKATLFAVNIAKDKRQR